MEDDKLAILLPLPDISVLNAVYPNAHTRLRDELIRIIHDNPEICRDLNERYIMSLTCRPSVSNLQLVEDALDLNGAEIGLVKLSRGSQLKSFLRIRLPASTVRRARIHESHEKRVRGNTNHVTDQLERLSLTRSKTRAFLAEIESLRHYPFTLWLLYMMILCC